MNAGRASVVIGIWLAVATCVEASEASKFPPWNAGWVRLSLVDPVQGGPMPGVLFYPTVTESGPTAAGPFVLEAMLQATPASGRFPLILISHGTGGSALGHHDSATHLARHGFLVAAVTHPGDNFRDRSGFGTDIQLAGRSHHMIALLDGVLAHPTHGAHVDRDRIGIAGFSAGGYTALLTIGARPDLDRLEEYCRTQPDDAMMCPRGPASRVRITRPDLTFVADRRIKAAVVMAPALGFLFHRVALAGVTAPVRLYRAGRDEVLRHPFNAEQVRQNLPTPPEYEVLEGAGHYVFLAPCSESLRREAAEICTDPPGIDRRAIHARLNSDIVTFFRRTLGAR